MSLKELISSANDILKTYHTVSQSLVTLEGDIRGLTSEFRELRLEHVRLEGRVSRLEEGRETIKVKMRALLAEALSKHEIEFVRAEAKLEVEYTKAAAELYKKSLENRASAMPTPELIAPATEQT